MESEANCGRRYREGQEDQLGALGLVLNVIVLWNTIYIEAALEQLRQGAQPVHEEDIARLSPLLRGYGRFSRLDLERLIWSDYFRQLPIFSGPNGMSVIAMRPFYYNNLIKLGVPKSQPDSAYSPNWMF
jgi:hypothetical protein